MSEEDQHDGLTSARTGSMIARPAATHRARPWMQSVLAARKSSGVALRVPDTARAIVHRPRSPPPPGSPSSSPPRSPRSQPAPPTGARTVHTASWQLYRQYYSASAWSSLATACRHACQCVPLMRAHCVFSPRAEGFDGGMSRVVHRLWNDNDTSSERPTPSRHATPRGHHRSSVATVLLFLFSFVLLGCAVTGPLERNYDDATQY